MKERIIIIIIIIINILRSTCINAALKGICSLSGIQRIMDGSPNMRKIFI